MQVAFLAAFAGYLFAMIALSWWVSRKNSSGEDFLLGGRDLPLLLTLGTTVATMVGTGSSMGAVGFGYEFGWAGTLYGIGGAIGILLLAWWFAPVRSLRFMTMSEELSYYVGADKRVKNLIACIIYVASIGWLGAHIIGGGMYLAWLTGMDLASAKALLAVSFAVYVVIGGYSAVVWTDAIQALILFFGFILMAGFSVHAAGGWDALVAAQPRQNLSWLGIEAIGVIPAFSLSLAILVGMLATPSFRQRIYSGRNIGTIRRSFIFSGALYLLFSAIPAIIGMSAYALKSDLDVASFAFPHLALNVLPLSLGVLIILAGISATLSSASSDAIAAVSVLLRDLYVVLLGHMPKPQRVVLLSRAGLVATIGIALGFALLSNDIIGYITSMISILMAGMCMCGILGRFWPRYNWQGAIATLVAGSLTALAVTLYEPASEYLGNPIIPALIGATLAGVVVTLLTPAANITPQQALEILNKERDQMEGIDGINKIP